MISRAPWTSAQCNRITAHQERDDRHPLTCGEHSGTPLRVALRGLWCPWPTCEYRQEWVHMSIAGEA